MPNVNDNEGKSRRRSERFKLALPVRVQCRESLDHEWVEMSRLGDVTSFGARLSLSRPTEPGRLLHLTLPMPRLLRNFDHTEDQYRIWALVRNMKLLDPDATTNALVEIGVAFLGKLPPKSYETDPTLRYQIDQTSTDGGLWLVTGKQLSEMPEKRKESRHSIPIEVQIEVFGKEKGFSASERTVTANISRHGAAVFTSLDIATGRFIRLSSEQYGVSMLAAVRTRRVSPEGIPHLHLEFVGGEWPLEGVS